VLKVSGSDYPPPYHAKCCVRGLLVINI